MSMKTVVTLLIKMFYKNIGGREIVQWLGYMTSILGINLTQIQFLALHVHPVVNDAALRPISNIGWSPRDPSTTRVTR